jgi:hypothetical protein
MKVASGDSWVGRIGLGIRRDAGLYSLTHKSLVLILGQSVQGATSLLGSSRFLCH